jgi:mono/diheme cytochrome c family protein
MKNYRVFAALGVLSLALGPMIAGCKNDDEGEGRGAPPGGQTAAPGAPGPGGAGTLTASSTGAEIFAAKCQGCHGANGQGASGPSIVGEADDSVEKLAGIIRDGKEKMPAFKGQLTEEQITKVAEHVKTLK